ncbi:hypothetical protein Nwi_0966 [Nitrobacter winogradskyi Nb-255]|uniref:Uncharacterized protein n=1 Tax=Nitrobacter winogradskyi (strain ATCC 25391 / DSM 10237 / CIP 104748 / NCIMB 11846 / Nb-255) TaxID=323098 RepID=Q3SU13_NITWN|nr:hypothetical protein [Nitrobacter winogradskyi]ABA04228.1 hypothetical protein Nwi_0966 [Nitrobacter winogradskyi Nb-255]
MCDYSLHHVSSRPAQVGDQLVTMELARSSARGFAAVGEIGARLVVHDDAPQMAVCLLPGTELAFDAAVEYDRALSPKVFGVRVFGKARVNYTVASFRQVNLDDPYVQHDALEFPNGEIVKINRLIEGQTATVLQLPAVLPGNDLDHEHAHAGSIAPLHASRLVLNRGLPESGAASILVPNLGVATLWDALRGMAVSLRVSLMQAFRRLTARKPDLHSALPVTDSHSIVPVIASPRTSANPTSDKSVSKTAVKASAELPSA